MLRILPLALAIWWLYDILTASRRARRAMDARSRVSEHPRVRRLARELQDAARLDRRPLRELDEDAVNALVVPDGQIYLTRGLVQRFDRGEVSEDELAFVIGHELGHHAHGHAQRRLQGYAAQTAAGYAARTVMGRFLPGWVGLMMLVMNAARPFIASRISQANEFEADAYGAKLLRRLGRDPMAGGTLLQKIEAWSGRRGRAAGPQAWLASHPPTAKRVERLAARTEG